MNHDNVISGFATTVIESSTVYPAGTNEIFPNMQDSEGTASYTSAHYYMECSNKGICDRTTGQCDCYDGYDGTACQRASCPNDCSGHGTCETISELAFDNFENVYALWDKDATMGCACDAGYTAADCSQRHCKVGVDPLYEDDTTARHTIVDVNFYTTAADKLGGTFQVKFYDVWGEDYVTVPITADGSAPGLGDNTCAPLVAALVALPNDVINSAVPPTCVVTEGATAVGFTMRISFVGNPGYFKSLEILTAGLTDVDSAFATASTAGAKVATIVTGENTDYFASQCSGVTGIFTADATWADKAGSHGHLLIGTEAQKKLLKACLGDSDGQTGNNVEVYNWDYGNMQEMTVTTATTAANPLETPLADDLAYVNVIGAFPHAIKVISTVAATGVAPASELHLLWWDPLALEAERFRVAGRNADETNAQNIYTTNGVVQQLGYDRMAIARNTDNEANLNDNILTSNRTEVRIVGYFSQYTNLIYTNIDASCESTNSRLNGLHNCIQKGDKLFVVDGCWGIGKLDGTSTEHFGGVDSSCADATTAATGTGNLYTVNKIYTKPWTINTDEVMASTATADAATGAGGTPMEDRFVIQVDQNLSWDGSTLANTGSNAIGVANSGYIVLFKFTPASDGAGSYTYVSECSNRGACDRESGLCQCFKGYTSDNCSVQSSLAV